MLCFVFARTEAEEEEGEEDEAVKNEQKRRGALILPEQLSPLSAAKELIAAAAHEFSRWKI